MTVTSSDHAASLSSIESIKSYIVGVITAAAASRGPRVELTFVGGEFMKWVGASFERHLNKLAEEDGLSVPKSKRKLADFIEGYCSDLIGRERSPAGTWQVFPIEVGEVVKEGRPLSTLPAALRFKPAVWAAFIRPLQSAHRFLNLEQIGFTDADEAPAVGSWKEIDRKYILGAGPKEAVDGARVQSSIEDWAASSSVRVSTLVVSAGPEISTPLKNLLDLVESLPAEIAAAWTIPASVLKHLARAR